MANRRTSPCAKPECIGKSKLRCSATCEELAEYQDYLARTQDRNAYPDFEFDSPHSICESID